MLTKRSPRRVLRVITLAVSGSAVVALAVPAVSGAAYPTGNGRLSVSDGTGRSHSIWADGTHKTTEFFDGALQYTAVSAWHAGGKKVAVIDPANSQAAYVFTDGNTTPTTIQGLNGEMIVSAAVGPDGSRVVTSSDPAGVKIRNGGVTSSIYENPSGRVAWSAEGAQGTIVWDGYPTADAGDPSGGGIPGGDVFGSPPPAFDATNAGIWVSVQGGQPHEIVTDPSAANPSISQDGRIIAYSAADATNSASDIFILDLSEANPQPKRLPGSSLSGNDEIPAVSPDGKQVAFIDSTNTQSPKLVIADVAGGPATLVENVSQNGILGLAWQPAVQADAGTVGISGTAEVGQTLTVTGDPATGSQPLTVAYAWQRCVAEPSDQDDCTDIPGATSSSYVVQKGDEGYRLRLKRRATNAAGDETVVSSLTATVTDVNANPTPVDTTPPGLPSIASGPSATDSDTTPTFSWTGAEPGGTFQCQIVGALVAGGTSPTAWADCASPFTTPELADGPHEFRVRQVDAAGNAGTYRAYDWDVQAPAPADTTPPLKPTWQSFPPALDTHETATFAWLGAEPGGTFECLVTTGLPESDAGWTACSSPYTTPALPDGHYRIQVRQVDAAGNAGASRSYFWEVDTTPPGQVVLLETPKPTTRSTTATFTFEAREHSSTIECRIDAPADETDPGAWGPCASPVELTGLQAGKHRFEVREVDQAGNASAPTVWHWTVEPPAVDAPVTDEPVEQEPVEVQPKPETPAVAAPEPARAPKVADAVTPTPAPAAKPTKAKAPALVATVGGTTSGPQAGADGRTSSAATIQVAKESVSVGCAVTGTVLKSCKVDLYAPVARRTAAHAVSVKQVLVGSGTYDARNGAEKMNVRITLNAAGRSLLRTSPAGLKVAVRITGTPVSGAPLKATGAAKLLSDRAALTVGGFAVNSATLTPAAKRQLRALAAFGKAATVRCVGHTDGAPNNSRGYLRRLGAARAEAVCELLARYGVRASNTSVVSKADTVPAATNATASGRGKNRRVEVTIVR